MRGKIKFFLAFLISLLLLLSPSLASTLHSQNVEVHINDDGSVKIVEYRNMSFDEGTEIFIVQDNMGDSEILDFTVSENGKNYEKVDNWNIDLSLEEKAEKSGIVRTQSGYELCFSPGAYGDYNFELEYTISNFIKSPSDGQMIYWRFINDQQNAMPRQAQVKILAPQGHRFSIDNTKVWAFGYSGDILIHDQEIIASTDSPMFPSNYLTVLAQFLEPVSSNANRLEGNLKYWEELAKEGSDYKSRDENYNHGPSSQNTMKLIDYGLLSIFLIPFGLILLGIISGIRNRQPKFTSSENIGYHRKIPYKENPIDIAYLLNINQQSRNDWLTMFFLKWIYEGKLESIDFTSGWLFSKEEFALKIRPGSLREIAGLNSNILEVQLFEFVLKAAGEDGILAPNEFSKYASKNISSIRAWYKKVESESLKKMIDQGFLYGVDNTGFLAKGKKYYPTKEGQVLIDKIQGFKNYLENFSLLNEREDIHVHIWDELMIWAGIFGITEKVVKQFEKLYPKYFEDGYSTYNPTSLYLANNYSRNFVSSSTQSSSSSSGGGGSSSFSGGGGSFGGGSGGGTR